MNLKWYLNRLKTMSPAESFYRAKQLLNRQIDKSFKAGNWPKTNGLLENPKPILDIEDDFFDDYTLPEEWNILGINLKFTDPKTVKWHKCLKTDKTYPLVFSRDVNTRNDEQGIAKYVWEPNRLNFLPHLAMQIRKSGDEKYVRKFVELMTSWMEENPYMMGVNWYSNIEVNIRLINWWLCWEIMDANYLSSKYDYFKKFTEEVWIKLIYAHCVYSKNHPSFYSSANNHRISEVSGLFISSSFWKFKDSKEWNRYSRKHLEKEILTQNSKNGINKEETSEYIQFITDFFLLPKIVADAKGEAFSDHYNEVLYKSICYIGTLMNINGKINHYGDADEGRVCVLQNRQDQKNESSLLQTGALLFGDKELLKLSPDLLDLKNKILLGKSGIQKWEDLNTNKNGLNYRGSRFFKEEGHFFFRKEDSQKEMFMHFNAGELGFLAIAAHGHSDALSFNLSVNGQWYIVDTGTFSYHTDMDWRNYFVSTMAHNTISINGENQALRGGPTMWRDHYKCNILSVQSSQQKESVTACHNGYEDKYGILHERRIDFDKTNSIFCIYDLLKGAGNQTAFINFHIHPDINAELKNYRFQLENPSDLSSKVVMELDENINWKLIKGEENPIMGWYSDGFYEKEKAFVLSGEINLSNKKEVKTIIKLNEK